ncbi:NAD(P)H-binding protein [Nocardia abscessus]|uniref:NmrA family NAD(P)-binding protein n=1 Tax=Nocardia abscessus TaxID=120957 RepID=UPI00313F19AB
MKVFVAGSTGAIGRYVVAAAVDAGHEVTALVRTEEKAAAGKRPWLRVPGRAALVGGHRLTSLTRSLRVSNNRFRAETNWSPRYPSARAAWLATAAPVGSGSSEV